MEGEGDVSHGILFSNSNDASSPLKGAGQEDDVSGAENGASDDDDDLLWQTRGGSGHGQRQGKRQGVDILGSKEEGEGEEEGDDFALALSEDSFDMLGELLNDLPPVGTKTAPPPPRPLLGGTGLVQGTRTEARASGQGIRSPRLMQQQHQGGPVNTNTVQPNHHHHHHHNNNNNNEKNSDLKSPQRGVSSPSKQPPRGKIVASSLSKPLTLSHTSREGTGGLPTTTHIAALGVGVGVGVGVTTSLQLSVGNSMSNRHPSPGSPAAGIHRATTVTTPDMKKKTTTTTTITIPKQFAFPSASVSVPVPAPTLSAALAVMQQQQQHGPGKVAPHRNGKSPF